MSIYCTLALFSERIKILRLGEIKVDVLSLHPYLHPMKNRSTEWGYHPSNHAFAFTHAIVCSAAVRFLVPVDMVCAPRSTLSLT